MSTWRSRRVKFSGSSAAIGAGKSTLLKVLSRITAPTEGRIAINGRIGSLLEVGTGFHPELTGRENIFLNGSILGMSRREVARKFDEIVAFAEIEPFLDTPVKRYSSGMYVRLAFAVAAHLEPEILVIDEVLAVGDSEFQRKCIRRMDQVASLGSTILFVSHNLGTVRTFCKRGCYLHAGRLVSSGAIDEVLEAYLGTAEPASEPNFVRLERPPGAGLWMEHAALIIDGQNKPVLETGDALELEVAFRSERPIRNPKLGFAICTQEGTALMALIIVINVRTNSIGRAIPGTIHCKLGPVPLLAGCYFLSLWLGDDHDDYHQQEFALGFAVADRDIWGTGRLPPRCGHCWWPTEFTIG